jgi:hypothetical protein
LEKGPKEEEITDRYAELIPGGKKPEDGLSAARRIEFNEMFVTSFPRTTATAPHHLITSIQ